MGKKLKRMSTHRRNLKGLIDKEFEPIYFDSGADAKDLESSWKSSPYVKSVEVEGFITECVLVNNETTKMIFG